MEKSHSSIKRLKLYHELIKVKKSDAMVHFSSNSVFRWMGWVSLWLQYASGIGNSERAPDKGFGFANEEGIRNKGLPTRERGADANKILKIGFRS